MHATATTGSGELVAPMILAGIGISMAIPTVPSAVLGAVAPRDLGSASGVQNTLTRFGSVFAVAVASAVFAASGRLGSPATFIAGFTPALVVVAGLSAVGGVSALFVSERQRQAVLAMPEPAQAVA